jgi:hypothetical protein
LRRIKKPILKSKRILYWEKDAMRLWKVQVLSHKVTKIEDLLLAHMPSATEKVDVQLELPHSFVQAQQQFLRKE